MNKVAVECLLVGQYFTIGDSLFQKHDYIGVGGLCLCSKFGSEKVYLISRLELVTPKNKGKI